MLGGLRGVDQRGIQHRLVLDLAGDFLGFLDDAVDRRAIDRLGLDAMHLEHLLQPLDVDLVSSRWVRKPCFSCASVALSAIFGSAFKSCFSA